MTKKLNMLATIQDGLRIALVNFLSLIAATILYILTIWIPYLNVGTTIAMSSLPAELSKGKVINPLFIFEGKYRRDMGEFFILIALMTIGTPMLVLPSLSSRVWSSRSHGRWLLRYLWIRTKARWKHFANPIPLPMATSGVSSVQSFSWRWSSI